ncbi:Glycosyltransferase-like KOBITO 1 [Nymphon striatum]|nr:Glycosyltransferase-like KOBITO 1 [Nymphon striatum]
MSKIAIISTVKSSPDELSKFVNYHLNIGIDNVILFFDDPKDESVSLFDSYPQVISSICSDEYWKCELGDKPDSIEARQVHNVNNGVKLAEDKGCGWIAHIDSDELIFNVSGESLISQLEEFNADIVKMSVREAVAEQEENDHIFQSKWFKKPVPTKKIETAFKYGCKNAIFQGEYFRGHLDSKAFVKIGQKIKKYGIHYPTECDEGVSVIQTEDIKLLHYDCVSFEAWNLKWLRRLDGSALAKKMRKNRKVQFQEFEQAKNKGHDQLKSLFRRMHTLPQKEKLVLRLLGCGRSGTTIFGTTLSHHKDITYLNEPRDLWFSAYPETDIWTAEAEARQGKLALTKEDAEREKSTKLVSLFQQELLRGGSQVLIEKLPINNFRLSFIQAIFPNARFIHIYRNGLEVARSIEMECEKGNWFGSGNYKWDKLTEYEFNKNRNSNLSSLCETFFDKGLLEWRLSTEAAVDFLSQLPKEKYYELKYDSLIDHPEEMISEVLEFIGLGEDHQVSGFIAESLSRRTSKLNLYEITEKQRKLGGKLLPISMGDKTQITKA